MINCKFVSTWMFWKKRRYVVTLMSCLGVFMLYALRINLSVAIVQMTANRTFVDENGTVTYGQEFHWNTKIQGYVLSSYFYGYISTQFFGGWLASRIGGKLVFCIGIAGTSIFTLLTPIASCNVYILIFIRLIGGIFSGCVFPSMNELMSTWAPPSESSKLMSFVYSGGFTSNVLSMIIYSVMSQHLGWPSIFYSFGVIGLIWSLCWYLIVHDKPEDDPFISASEIEYIKTNLDNAEYTEDKESSNPWKAILTSSVVWTIILSETCETWGLLTMMTQLPTFMAEALHMTLEEAGSFSGLPFLAMSIVLVISGQLADYLRSKKILTTTQTRKSFICTAFIFQTIFLTYAAFMLTPTVAVICITITLGLGGTAWSGVSVNYFDIAPNHVGVIYGFANTIAVMPGIISPIITGYIVPDETSAEWKNVFLITSGFYFFGALIYGFFGSGELQAWAVRNDKRRRSSLH